MSAAGSRHMERVAGLPCCVCEHMGRPHVYGVQVHHIREGQGAAQRADDMLTIPVCYEHHLGASGIHGLGRKWFYARYKIDELQLLAATLEKLEP